MKKRKCKLTLLSALTVSMLFANLAAAVSANGIYQEYDVDGWSQPAITVLMQGLAHQGPPRTSQSISSVSGNTQSGQDGSGADVPSGEQPGGSGADVPAVSVPYSFQEVTQEYFDDALLIGDSRVTGIQLYSGWDNMTYYAENGMTVYSMFDCKAAEEDGRMLTVEEALQERSFGKIYLEIGINEMGTGTVDSFMEAYEDAVKHLRELQPEIGRAHV